MSLFVDRLLLQLSDSDQLRQLLAPADDTDYNRLRALLNTMYNLEFAPIRKVQTIEVGPVELQRLLLTTHQTRGVWRQATPNYLHTDITYEGSDRLEPIWLDISARVQLTLLIEVDSGEIESIKASQFESVGDSQLERVTIKLRQPPPFDPQDPKNIQSYTLNLTVFIRDALDVAATLRAVKLARAITERATTYQKLLASVEVLAPYASIVIFPQNALNGLPFKEDALQKLFANEKVLALFMTPP
jgi:hypothetical protein